jgi:hypothetical protein
LSSGVHDILQLIVAQFLERIFKDLVRYELVPLDRERFGRAKRTNPQGNN